VASALVEATRRKELRELRTRKLLRGGSILAFLLLWEFAGRTGTGVLFPPFTKVLASLWDLLVSGELFDVLWVSNQSLIIGVPLALLVGIPAGIVLGRSRLVDRIFGVYVDILVVTPMVALIPIVIIVLGLNLSARVMMVFIFAVVTVVANLRTGARSVNPHLIEMARAFGTRGLQLWTKVLIPGMLPALGAAMRLSFSRGVVGMVIVELTLVSVGLGGLVMNSRALFKADMVFAGTVVILIEGLLLIRLGRFIESKVAPKGLYGGSGS